MDLALGARTLVLPSAMGERFQVIALERGVAGPWCGFSSRDLLDPARAGLREPNMDLWELAAYVVHRGRLRRSRQAYSGSAAEWWWSRP